MAITSFTSVYGNFFPLDGNVFTDDQVAAVGSNFVSLNNGVYSVYATSAPAPGVPFSFADKTLGSSENVYGTAVSVNEGATTFIQYEFVDQNGNPSFGTVSNPITFEGQIVGYTDTSVLVAQIDPFVAALGQPGVFLGQAVTQYEIFSFNNLDNTGGSVQSFPLQFQTTGPSALIPEPSGAVLMIVAVCGFIATRAFRARA